MKIPTSKGKKKMAPDRIFSGLASCELWGAILTAQTTEQLRVILYDLCCKLQELEVKMEKEGK